MNIILAILLGGFFGFALQQVMLATGSEKFEPLLPMIPDTLLAAAIGIVFMLIAWKRPKEV